MPLHAGPLPYELTDNFDVVDHIFSCLSPLEQRVTIGVLSKKWHEYINEWVPDRPRFRLDLHPVPMWHIQHFWHKWNKYQQEKMLWLAARNGDLPAMQWMQEHTSYVLIDYYTGEAAIQSGNLEALDWLHAHNCPIGWPSWVTALSNANRGLLLRLKSYDPEEWDVHVCEKAAQYGRVELLQWLREQDPPCPWDVGTCKSAAAYGHLELLQWLRAQNPPCPWDTSVFITAATYSFMHILQWMWEQHRDEWDMGMVMAHAGEMSREVLDWLIAVAPND